MVAHHDPSLAHHLPDVLPERPRGPAPLPALAPLRLEHPVHGVQVVEEVGEAEAHVVADERVRLGHHGGAAVG